MNVLVQMDDKKRKDQHDSDPKKAKAKEEMITFSL
jgi:hypothetical protein